jgi:zinc transport system substrate-binding protein
VIRNWVLTLLLASATFALGGLVKAHCAEPLNVVVTIKPIHSLAAAVMQGAGTPHLLLKGASSEHSYSLRPSDARVLNNADIVVRVSDRLESFLQKPMASLSAKIRIVTLIDAPGMKLLAPRLGGVFEAHAHEGKAHDRPGDQGHEGAAAARGASAWQGDTEHDPHLWLSPANAAVIADTLAASLAQARPEQAALFKDNAARLKTRLAALDAQLRTAVAALRSKDFIVFHDAYQYFEREYGLHAAGAITLSPERQPGAARLKDIRARIAASHAPCVFSEPQFEPKLVATLIEGTDAKTGVLDPLGADLAEGPEHYFQLMNALAASLEKCLGR